MAKYPIKVDLTKAKPAPKPAQNRPAPPVTQNALDRHAKRQAEEARGDELLMRRRPAAKDTISVVTRMRETPVKKGK